MRMHKMAFAAVLVFGVSHGASANVTFSLSGVTLSSSATGAPADEGVLSGTFTTNDARSSVLSFDILASAAGAFGGFDYTTANSSVTAAILPSQFFQLDSITGGNELRLYFSTALTSSGATIAPTFSYEHEMSGGNRYPSGSVVAAAAPPPPTSTPEPASLTLLGAGLLGAGLFRRRRG